MVSINESKKKITYSPASYLGFSLTVLVCGVLVVSISVNSLSTFSAFLFNILFIAFSELGGTVAIAGMHRYKKIPTLDRRTSSM